MNRLFYENKYVPKGIDCIEKVLRYDDTTLEVCHCYIQWLFPVNDFDSKYNSDSCMISEIDAQSIRCHPICSLRVLHAFERMLLFFGFRLSFESNEILVDSYDRLRFINNSRHNFLRITRILKSMNILGLGKLRELFGKALFAQTMNGTLNNAQDSLYQYWIPSLSAKEVEKNYAMHLIESSKLKQIQSYTLILRKTTCLYAAIMLRRILINDIWEKNKTWLILDFCINNENYLLMHMKSLQIKQYSKKNFDLFYCIDGVNLDTWNYVGLWIPDNISDIESLEIDNVLTKSFMQGRDEIKCAFFANG